ncbi:uncharacterized protein DEA37_0012125 [Paragonimus westermani]|uniref:DUF4806 domain-containing protein n=1 Tax=Paragonimus westermani TaxID=34504 RepID=A0A5J4NHZ7_9TREM|nr:uncharacterized protein DEA37_0012125 [Paragonimus westermani]
MPPPPSAMITPPPNPSILNEPTTQTQQTVPESIEPTDNVELFHPPPSETRCGRSRKLPVRKVQKITRSHPCARRATREHSRDDVVGTNERKRTPAEVVRAIAVGARLSLKAVGIMLSHSREVFPQLPLDARTVLGTPRKCACTFIEGGEYVHFGLAECISHAVRGRWTGDVNILRLQLHIDGLTLFNSSRLQLWPILERLISPFTPVFVVGLFCGLSKPVNVAEYLDSVIEDLSIVLRDGLLLSTYNRHVQVVLDCLVDDAPARAFIHQSFFLSNKTMLALMNTFTFRCIRLLTFLSGVGGTSTGECTRNVMRTLLTDELAKTINWRGVNNRVSISSSPLYAAIVESIMKKAYPGVSQADVKGTIQRWIQKARLRAWKEADDLVTKIFAM